MKSHTSVLFLATIVGIAALVSTVKAADCEGCVTTVKNFADTLSADVKSDPKKIEDAFKVYCKSTVANSKQNKLCYYLGGMQTSSTSILSELSRPLSMSTPPLKICENLKKKNAQICDLR